MPILTACMLMRWCMTQAATCVVQEHHFYAAVRYKWQGLGTLPATLRRIKEGGLDEGGAAHVGRAGQCLCTVPSPCSTSECA